MLGAIIGDIAGSIYEAAPIKRKDFTPLLARDADFTDDTVLTLAVAQCLVDGSDAARMLKAWGRHYTGRGYGGRFLRWLFSDDLAPYNSFGNGAAMRISPVALLADSVERLRAMTEQVTAPTHNHPEGIKGAYAVAYTIWLARQGQNAEQIRERATQATGYALDRELDAIRPGYGFDVTCQGSVPESILCALEAVSFTDAIRNAISLGGDADTMAAIAGAIAEARFGIPPDLAGDAWARLDLRMQTVLARLYAKAGVAAPWP